MGWDARHTWDAVQEEIERCGPGSGLLHQRVNRGRGSVVTHRIV
jgi:hypothetical protein